MIEMIAGVYGLRVKIGEDAEGNAKYRIKGMGPNDGPFSIAPEQEARLVDKRLARYVDDPTEDGIVDDGTPIGFGEIPPDDFAPDGVESVDDAEVRSIEDMTAKELSELGKEYGLSFKANESKASMIEKIKAAWPEPAEDEPAEDTPTFDASEAVL